MVKTMQCVKDVSGTFSIYDVKKHAFWGIFAQTGMKKMGWDCEKDISRIFPFQSVSTLASLEAMLVLKPSDRPSD